MYTNLKGEESMKICVSTFSSSNLNSILKSFRNLLTTTFIIYRIISVKLNA